MDDVVAQPQSSWFEYLNKKYGTDWFWHCPALNYTQSSECTYSVSSEVYSKLQDVAYVNKESTPIAELALLTAMLPVRCRAPHAACFRRVVWIINVVVLCS